MSDAVERGWAVWFWLEQPGSKQRVWVNHGGGYSPSRRCRKVFGSRWEADEACDERRDRKPTIMLVVYSARPRRPSGAPKEAKNPDHVYQSGFADGAQWAARGLRAAAAGLTQRAAKGELRIKRMRAAIDTLASVSDEKKEKTT